MSQYGSVPESAPTPPSPPRRRLPPLLPTAAAFMGASSFLPSTIVTGASAVGSGLVGGLMFAFSNFVMQALDAQHTEAAVAAMNAINVKILNPYFFVIFVGTAATSAATLVIAVVKRSQPASEPLRLTGAAFYIVGVFLVTMFRNVPLNDELAKTVVLSTEQGTIEASV